MPSNAKQELDSTPAVDQAVSDSGEESGADIIGDRVDRKIQGKLSKQTDALEKNPDFTEGDEKTPGQTPEQAVPPGKNAETDTDDKETAEDTPEPSENDTDTEDEDDGETEEDSSEDSEQGEESAQPSSDQHSEEWARRRQYLYAHEQRSEGWLLVVFTLAIIALLLILAFVFGFRVRGIEPGQANVIETVIFHEQIAYYLFLKLL